MCHSAHSWGGGYYCLFLTVCVGQLKFLIIGVFCLFFCCCCLFLPQINVTGVGYGAVADGVMPDSIVRREQWGWAVFLNLYCCWKTMFRGKHISVISLDMTWLIYLAFPNCMGIVSPAGFGTDMRRPSNYSASLGLWRAQFGAQVSAVSLKSLL